MTLFLLLFAFSNTGNITYPGKVYNLYCNVIE